MKLPDIRTNAVPLGLLDDKFLASDGTVPGEITPVVVLDDLRWVFDDLGSQKTVVLVEVQPGHLTRVKQPEVVIGQASRSITG